MGENGPQLQLSQIGMSVTYIILVISALSHEKCNL